MLLESAPVRAPDGASSGSLSAFFQFLQRLKHKDWAAVAAEASAGQLAVLLPESVEVAGLLLNIILEVQQMRSDSLEVLSTHASAVIYLHVVSQLMVICQQASSSGSSAAQATRLLHLIGGNHTFFLFIFG